MNQSRTAKTLSSITLVAGLWLIVSPFVLGYSSLSQAVWNDMVVGGAVAVASIVLLLRPLDLSYINWLLVLLGAWLVLSPFILGYGNFGNPGETINTKGARWTDIILGLVVLSLAIVNVTVNGDSRDIR